jgi:hypothetical protein
MTQHEAEAVQGTPVDSGLSAANRRSFLKKAGIAGAAVWAAPTLLSATAAHAQGTCAPETLDWDAFTVGSLFTNAATTGANPVTVTLGLANVPAPPTTTPQANNGRIVAGPSGGIAGNALFVGQNSQAPGVGQTITFSFSQPVYNLSFTVTDLDNQSNAWFDLLEILTAGYTFAFAGTTLLTGNGTNANRFRNTNNNLNLPNTDARGNVTLTWAGPVSSVQMRYTNGNQSGGSQLIRITDLTFNPC